MIPAALPPLLSLLAAEPGPPANSYFTIEVVDEQTGRGVPLVELKTGTVPVVAGGTFHALPADAKDPPATTVPLHEFVGPDGKTRAYSTDETWPEPGYRRAERPVCRVWANPLRVDLSRE